MKKIAAFNWKLKPTTLKEAQATIKAHKKWAKKYPDVQVISAPPMPFVHKLVSDVSPVSLCAQDASLFFDGAHTGESSSAMLREVGCTYVILGHSERRSEHNETNQDVSKKASLSLEQGLKPIVCFGETARDRKGIYIDFLTKQLTESLATISEKDITKVVLAYEPVWAIGTGETITSNDLFSTIILIKKILVGIYGERRAKRIPILYGGSVKDNNAVELAAVSGVSGFLVGGASHKPEQVQSIVASLS